jgi:hypothetical protein
MRHALRAREIARLCADLNGQRINSRYGNRSDILLIKTRLGERLNGRSGTLMRGGTASFVCATTRLTRLWTGRIRDDARRGWQSYRRYKKRESDCHRHRDFANHHATQ